MSEEAPDVIAQTTRVLMRDGVELSAHIYRPAADGPSPALMTYSPYRKGPLRASHPYAQRGYSVVQFDVRGTGDSAGVTTDIYSAEERQDGYDMVEWTAAQPWCTGKVGMWGISFGAVACLQVAMMAPPHLGAIVVRSGTDDVYTEWTNPGGSPRPYMYMCYGAIMAAFNLAPPHADVCGDKWAEVWRQRLRGNEPWSIGFLKHLKDGPYWRERSLRGKYDRVRCPVFVIGGWNDWYATPLLRTFANLSVPKRGLVGPWSHLFPSNALPGPRIDGDREILRWFDHWLKGEDTGIVDEPLLTIFVREYCEPVAPPILDAGDFRCERQWPPARAHSTSMYLCARGKLRRRRSRAAPGEGDRHEYDPTIGVTTGMHGGGPFDLPWTAPVDQRPDEALSLTYTSEPLGEDMEVIGHPVAVLHVSSAAEVAAFVVKLCDVAPDGTSALVTKGFLNATHRESHVEPSPLEPGAIYELNVELLACAWRFRAGHRIRVVIASADFQNIWPTPRRCVNTLYRNTSQASRIVLPVTPPPAVELPPPNLAPSPVPLPRREELDRPKYSVSRDPVSGKATVRYTAQFSGPHVAAFTVSAKSPAEAEALADADFRYAHEGKEIRVNVHAVTTSDQDAFHHTLDAEVTLDGAPHFRKSWSVDVPREDC